VALASLIALVVLMRHDRGVVVTPASIEQR
jgi:hypothetical protein